MVVFLVFFGFPFICIMLLGDTENIINHRTMKMALGICISVPWMLPFPDLSSVLLTHWWHVVEIIVKLLTAQQAHLTQQRSYISTLAVLWWARRTGVICAISLGKHMLFLSLPISTKVDNGKPCPFKLFHTAVERSQHTMSGLRPIPVSAHFDLKRISAPLHLELYDSGYYLWSRVMFSGVAWVAWSI